MTGQIEVEAPVAITTSSLSEGVEFPSASLFIEPRVADLVPHLEHVGRRTLVLRVVTGREGLTGVSFDFVIDRSNVDDTAGCYFARLRVAAALNSDLSARAFTLSPSRKSMARRILPSRLELKRPVGSSSFAPFAKVNLTTSL